MIIHIFIEEMDILHSLTIKMSTLKKIKMSTFKYHVFAPMGRFQLELIYL